MKDTSTISPHNPGFPWASIFPDVLWILFWLLLLFFSKDFIKSAISMLLYRLKHGAGVKIGSFELEALKISAGQPINNKHIQSAKDEDGVRNNERSKLRSEHRGAMLVHKLYKSAKDGQLFDILIYVIPKEGKNLIQVTSVEYYFGKYWGHLIYTSSDRSNGFAVATSAYGSFMCTAKINFNDGTSVTEYRYIDFEMGDTAPIVKDDAL